MRLRVMTISCGARTSRFLVLSRDISVGLGPGNDFIVCHPGLPQDGRRLGESGAGPPDGTGNKPSNQEVRGLPKSTTRGDLTLRVLDIPWRAVALAALATVLALRLAFATVARLEPVQDWSLIPLPAEGPFGLCRQDAIHPQGARFSLPEGAAQGAVLEFVVGGSGPARTVRLTLNGRIVRDDIALSRGWGKAIQVTLSPDAPVPAGSVIEVRPSPAGGPASPWGIQDLRLLPQALGAEPDWAAFEAAEAALNNPLAEGPDLAACYLRLTRLASAGASGAVGREESLAHRLEDRMELAIRAQLLRARALALSGRAEEAASLRDGLSLWVPPGWIEGREMLGGFEF